MFGVLGTIEFEAMGSPESIRRESAVNYPEHKVVQDKPKLQFLGPELDEVTLELRFHQRFTNPRLSRDAIYMARDAHMPLPLVFATGEHWGIFVITKAVETHKWMASDGTPLALDLSLSLKEWVTDIDASTPPQPATPPLALVNPGQLQPGKSPAGTIVANPNTGARVVAFQQPITGASALVNNPAPSGPNLLFTDVFTDSITRKGVG